VTAGRKQLSTRREPRGREIELRIKRPGLIQWGCEGGGEAAGQVEFSRTADSEHAKNTPGFDMDDEIPSDY